MTREDIVNNVKNTLTKMKPALGLLSREFKEQSSLDARNFPAVFIHTHDETRTAATTGPQRTVTAELSIMLQLRVMGALVDEKLNSLILGVEKELAKDRTRGGHAIDTQVIEIMVDRDPTLFQSDQGSAIMNVEVQYLYKENS